MQRTATEPQRGSSGEVLPRPATERSQRAGGNGGHRTCTLVWAFLTRVSTTPAADFCCRIRVNYSTLSLEFETCNRSPAISSTAFDTRPPDLPPALLMDTDFAISCPLVQRRRPPIRFLSIGPSFAPRFLQTPPHGDALALRYPSPPSGWDGTFTRKLPNMRGVQQKPQTPKLATGVLLFF